MDLKILIELSYRIINLDNIQRLIDEKKISKELNVKSFRGFEICLNRIKC